MATTTKLYQYTTKTSTKLNLFSRIFLFPIFQKKTMGSNAPTNKVNKCGGRQLLGPTQRIFLYLQIHRPHPLFLGPNIYLAGAQGPKNFLLNLRLLLTIGVRGQTPRISSCISNYAYNTIYCIQIHNLSVKNFENSKTIN